MTQYSIEPRTKKFVKGYGFLSIARNFSNKYRKKILDTGLDDLKTVSKKVVHKATEAKGEFIGNKITDAVTKLKDDKVVKQKPAIDEN